MSNKGIILAIDYGKKRTGLAATDPLQIIASPLTTVATKELFDFLKGYIQNNSVCKLVVGLAKRMSGEDSLIEKDITKFIQQFKKKYPNIPVYREDESYTSVQAAESIFLAGTKRKKRQDKRLLDKVSAAIILQRYLQQQS